MLLSERNPVNMRILKLDSLGDSVWVRSGNEIALKFGRWIEGTSDNGFVVTGSVIPDGFHQKWDEHGNLEWERLWGVNDASRGYCIHVVIVLRK